MPTSDASTPERVPVHPPFPGLEAMLEGAPQLDAEPAAEGPTDAERIAQRVYLATEQLSACLPGGRRAFDVIPDDEEREAAEALAEALSVFYRSGVEDGTPLARLFACTYPLAPDAILSRPRLSFTRASERGPAAKPHEAPSGYTVHRCAFTGARFTLPPGSFCPVIEAERLDPLTREPLRGERRSLPVHPSFLAEGPKAFAAEAWRSARVALEEALAELDITAERVQLLAAFDAEAAPPWPEHLFTRTVDDGNGYRREEAGFGSPNG